MRDGNDMNILLIGGTGVISRDVAQYAVSIGHNVSILNRGKNPERMVNRACLIKADIRNDIDVQSAISDREFDVVADFLSYVPEQIVKTFSHFKNRCTQFIYISSATAYCTTPPRLVKTEQFPIFNPLWDYALNKSRCEEALVELCKYERVKYTIVRPYITYGDTRIPYGVVPQNAQWSLIHRIVNRKPVLLWDGGVTVCTLTHASDFAKGFVGLFGNAKALNKVFHITSDERITWREVLETIAKSVGEKAIIASVPSSFIAQHMPELSGMLLGDRATDMIFDNSNIKQAVPSFVCTTPIQRGIARTIDYYNLCPAMKRVDFRWDARMDWMIEKFYRENDRTKLKEFNLGCSVITTDKLRNKCVYYMNRYRVLSFLSRCVISIRRKLVRVLMSSND